MNDRIRLILPGAEYAAELAAYKKEFTETGSSMDGCGFWKNTDDAGEFAGRCEKNRTPETTEPGLVPATQFLCVRVRDGKLVGMLQVRHVLNDWLYRFGGHIGYSVRPSERGKGYAHRMLRLALAYCDSLGIPKVLLTANPDNPASRRIILDCGGTYDGTLTEEGSGERFDRFWIRTRKIQVVCIGDSLTEGDYGIPGKSGIANVHEKNYPYFLGKLSGAEVINKGFCGWRSSNMRDYCLAGGADVTRADKVIVLLGSNGGQSPREDTPDNAAYRELVDWILRNAPRAELYLCTPPNVTENPIYSNCGYAGQVRDAVEFVRGFAEERNLCVIDLAASPEITPETEAELQSNDGIHFNEKGYGVLANIIFRETF